MTGRKRNSTEKGIAFTFDAVFSIIIVATVIPIFLLFSVDNSAETINQRLTLQAEDAIDTISRMHVRDFAKEPVIGDLYLAGVIGAEDLNGTIIELVSALWASNSSINNARAQNITQQILGSVIPDSVKWSFVIEDDRLVDSGSNFTATATASRRIVSGFRKGQPSAGYVASAFLTSIGGKSANSYYFFGGFVGQGNITAKISDIPKNSNITQIYLEVNNGQNFSFGINGIFCAPVNVIAGNISVSNFTTNSSTCTNSVTPGAENNFTINFTGSNITNQYVGGGYLRVTYSTKELLQYDAGLTRYRFPGINGLVNLFDSFYVPGNITNMNASITFFTGTNYTTIINIANVTVFNHTGNNSKTTVNISNSTFSQLFADNNISYTNLSSKTVPVRMVVLTNITGGGLNGTADVVLITDVSGSMAWRLDQDNVNGITINDCNNPNITQPSTARISLAKCLDKTFVNAILGGNATACGAGTPVLGNRVALVSFSSSANTWESLTTNTSYLESRINAYTASGGTCVSCAINRAYEILSSQSNASRGKYIVVMTDGVANYRSTPVCYDMNDASLNIAVGQSGASITRMPPWVKTNIGGTSDSLNKVSALNSTLARAGATGGEIYYWNGTAWILEQDTGVNDVYGIDLFNSTLGFAVGGSGKIWKWNGATWTETNDFGSFDFRGVSFFNSTLAFAVGESGRIYSWNGATWSLYQDVGTANLYEVDIYSPALAFAVGTSGKIYSWNSTAWSESTDTGSNTHRDVAILGTTKAFTVSSNGRAYEWNGASWSSTALSSYELKGLHLVNSTLAYAVGDERGDVYEWNGVSWSRTFSPFYYEGTSTAGLWCSDDDSCSLSISDSYPSLNANYSTYRAMQNLTNLSVDSVGFGPISICNIGNQTVSEIAKTGNGTSYASTNATQLQTIYCQIAEGIVTKSLQTQQLTAEGALSPSVIFPESSIEFSYVSTIPPASYQEITLDAETERFAGCDGSFFLLPNITVVDALRTSYSGFHWTKNVFLQNSLTGGMRNVYNLSSYSQKYDLLGDPFKIYIPVSLLAYNETNTVRNELGLNASYTNVTCSQHDRVIYRARLRASAPLGSLFPAISGGVIRIYHDLNHDGTQDGYTDITVGDSLTNFNPTVRTVDQLDTANNALDNAVMRLLDSLNLFISVSTTGPAGSTTNPIDIILDDVEIDSAGSGGIPYAWGPLDVKLEVGI